MPSEQNGWTGDNFAGWCFRDANRAIRQAVTALDPQERKQAYLVQQQKWTQEVPVVPLFQRLSVALVAPGIQGPQPDALAPMLDDLVMMASTGITPYDSWSCSSLP